MQVACFCEVSVAQKGSLCSAFSGICDGLVAVKTLVNTRCWNSFLSSFIYRFVVFLLPKPTFLLLEVRVALTR